MKDKITTLATEFESIQKDEMALTARKGEFDEKIKSLVTEMTGHKDGPVNLIQILAAYAKSA